MTQFHQAAAAYCNRWVKRPQFSMVNGVPIPTGKFTRYRPRLHPQVPHPGTGPGAIRMMTRLLTKEATLTDQHQARELAAQQERAARWQQPA